MKTVDELAFQTSLSPEPEGATSGSARSRSPTPPPGLEMLSRTGNLNPSSDPLGFKGPEPQDQLLFKGALAERLVSKTFTNGDVALSKARSESSVTCESTSPGSTGGSDGEDGESMAWNRSRASTSGASQISSPAFGPLMVAKVPDPKYVLDTVVDYTSCDSGPRAPSFPTSLLAMTARHYEAALNMVSAAAAQAASSVPVPPGQCGIEAANTVDAETPLSVMRLSDSILNPMLGSPELPSIGSLEHASGCCQPCAFPHGLGCPKGLACLHCHLCGGSDEELVKSACCPGANSAWWQQTITPGGHKGWSSDCDETAVPESALHEKGLSEVQPQMVD